MRAPVHANSHMCMIKGQGLAPPLESLRRGASPIHIVHIIQIVHSFVVAGARAKHACMRVKNVPSAGGEGDRNGESVMHAYRDQTVSQYSPGSGCCHWQGARWATTTTLVMRHGSERPVCIYVLFFSGGGMACPPWTCEGLRYTRCACLARKGGGRSAQLTPSRGGICHRRFPEHVVDGIDLLSNVTILHRHQRQERGEKASNTCIRMEMKRPWMTSTRMTAVVSREVKRGVA